MQEAKNINANIQKGYVFYLSNDMDEACDVWMKAWSELVILIDKNQWKSLDMCDNFFVEMASVTNWLTDFLKGLKIISLKKSDYYTMTARFCNDFLKRFEDNIFDSKCMEFRTAFAVALFGAGHLSKSEDYFKYCLRCWPKWDECWISWSECYLTLSDGGKKDFRKAATILDDAMKVEGIDPYKILQKLAQVYELLGDKEKVSTLKAAMKDAWVMNDVSFEKWKPLGS